MSSKHNETARQVVQEIIAVQGRDKFFKAVHLVVADQEFMPTVMNEFFTKLNSKEPLPIIPMLAIGHVMKGLSTSMMTYYRCFFDPMLEAMGVKVGSPEYNRYLKGREIRKTDELVTNFTEMLAVAAAHRYLQSMYAGFPGIKPWTVVGMDPHMRPIEIQVTDPLLSVAKDFQTWMRTERGNTRRAEVGPSGYQRKSEDEEPQQVDLVQEQLSKEIDQDTENFKRFADMKYGDDGDNPGLK